MPLAPKPDWFETTFTEWEFPADIPCARAPGRRAATVLRAVWSFGPGCDRRSEYRLTTNRGRKHWILWESGTDDGRVFFVPVAHGPCRGPHGEEIDALDAASHLLVAAWSGEDDAVGDFAAPLEARGLLEGEAFNAICREVWPSPARAAPTG